MIHRTPDHSAKSCFAGPWDSSLPVPVGYANQGIEEPHLHAQMYEGQGVGL
ncbi:hypothetical protein [Meiothermus taiwanensis]|uniref:Uncharacterized protein n=2 Tax=Meiothermus taiwanensis TaxID=172827 RepID=A0A399E9Q3_9DEIN|nr:hypothetical protein [Meiothermus taiwanensis]AWR87851.1 hypothetical protein Mtai_v1c26230 [Meiothermus taiwanensis WR-220]RIH79899.1 hypothetical protein Mcate_00126 [Meiothermus taiwanensis]